MTLISNIFWLYALQGLTYMSPLLLVPYLLRTIGPEHYGLVVLSQSLAQYFVIATDFGFNYSGTRAIAASRNDPEAFKKVFWTTAATKGALLMACSGVMLILLVCVPRMRSEYAIYAAAYVAVIGNALFPQWLFQGMENMRSISIVTGLTKIASALLIIVFVRHPKDSLLCVVLISSGQLLAGVIGIFLGLHRYVTGFYRPSCHEMKQTLREGQHLFLTTASISLFTNTNIMLVGLIAGNVQAGYFGVADKLARATSGFVYPVVQAAYPRAVRLLTESKEGFLSLLYKILLYGGLFSAVAATLTFLLTHEIGLAAFGKEIPAALVVIRVASLFPLIGTLSLIVGTLALIPLGFEKAQSRLLLGAGIFNVLIASVLIFYDGALGGVIGMVATETLVLVGSVAILSWRGAAFLPWSIRAQLS